MSDTENENATHGGDTTHEHDWQKEGPICRNNAVGTETAIVYTCAVIDCDAWKEERLNFPDKVGKEQKSTGGGATGIRVDSDTAGKITTNWPGEQDE